MKEVKGILPILTILRCPSLDMHNKSELCCSIYTSYFIKCVVFECLFLVPYYNESFETGNVDLSNLFPGTQSNNQYEQILCETDEAMLHNYELVRKSPDGYGYPQKCKTLYYTHLKADITDIWVGVALTSSLLSRLSPCDFQFLLCVFCYYHWLGQSFDYSPNIPNLW